MAVIELTTDNFEKEVLEYEGKVLVDFWASWCAPCMMMAPIVDGVAEELTDVKFGKVNVDNEPAIAIKYQVSSIPTLVLFDGGIEKDRSIGVISADELKSFIG